MKADITLRITRISCMDLRMLTSLVAMRMRDNPNFPDPHVPLDELDAKADLLQRLISEANGGSKQSLRERNALVRELRELLTCQAHYVRCRAGGDAVVLSSSGFALRREPSPIGQLAAPTGLRTRTFRGQGTLRLNWKPVRGAASYLVWIRECTPGGWTEWKKMTTTAKAKCELTGLKDLTRYAFRVNAIGAAGAGPMSGMLFAVAI